PPSTCRRSSWSSGNRVGPWAELSVRCEARWFEVLHAEARPTAVHVSGCHLGLGRSLLPSATQARHQRGPNRGDTMRLAALVFLLIIGITPLGAEDGVWIIREREVPPPTDVSPQ